MIGLILAIAAGLGVYLIYTAVIFGWRGLGFGPRVGRDRRTARDRLDDWLVQAGLGGVNPSELGTVVAMLFVLGGALSFAVFGGLLPAVVVGGFAATFPLAGYRIRRRARRERAQESWPRMIEEIRILTTALGRSIPQALFDAGRRAPEELRPAFEAAHREWLISTDFSRTVAVLKAQLADATADAACETLLVAHEVGGSGLDQRLQSLAEDRIQDTQGRKDSRAKQAGARFARWFVLIVPVGMALVGLSIGDGRAAYQSASGQLLVVAALVLIVVCWVWAGAIMRLPEEQRVFDR